MRYLNRTGRLTLGVMVIGAVLYATAGGAYADGNKGGAKSLTDVAANKATDVAPKDARPDFMTSDYATEGGGGVAAVPCPDPADCPASTPNGPDSTACVNQNCTKILNAGGSVACGAAGLTTENIYARCFDFAAEGVNLPFNVDVVKWGIEQLDSTTGDIVPVNINVYMDLACPPSKLTAVLLGSAAETVTVGDAGTIRLTPMPPGIVIPVGMVMVLEIEAPLDGTAGTPGLNHAFRPFSTVDACADAYLMSGSCGLADWLDVTAVGFPGSQFLLSAGGNDDPEQNPMFWNICGDGFVEGCEQCDPPDGITCDENCQLLEGDDCGNGVLDPGEECDPPFDAACPGLCLPDCTCPGPPGGDAAVFFTDPKEFASALIEAGKVSKAQWDWRPHVLGGGAIAGLNDPMDINNHALPVDPWPTTWPPEVDNVTFQANILGAQPPNPAPRTPAFPLELGLVLADAFTPNANVLIAANTFVDSFDIISGPPAGDNHTAISMVISSLLGSGFVDVTVYDKDEGIQGKITVEPGVLPPAEAFLGIIMTQGLTIGRINLFDAGGGAEGVTSFELWQLPSGPIPTVSEWGMIALTLLLLAVGGRMIVRRRQLA